MEHSSQDDLRKLIFFSPEMFSKITLHFYTYRCLEFLLQNDANPSIRDKEGYNSIHYAAAYGHRQCLELVSCFVLFSRTHTHTHKHTQTHRPNHRGINCFFQSRSSGLCKKWGHESGFHELLISKSVFSTAPCYLPLQVRAPPPPKAFKHSAKAWYSLI